MVYGSLFTGIGGFDLGFDRAGMSCAWQCEIDPFCCAVLEKHWPGVKRYCDVREIDDSTPRVDLICGGFPCQPHSVAGKRKGKDDERNLWPECIRVVRCLRPRWAVFENVPGLLTTMFGQVVSDLHGADYEVWPLVLGADDVGAPHRRKRVWIVAYDDCGRCGRWEASKKEQRIRQIVDKRGKAIRHSIIKVLEGRESIEGNDGEEQPSAERTDSGDDLANAQCRIIESRQGERRLLPTENGTGREIDNSGASKSGPHWPSGPGQPQHDWEAPRVVAHYVGRSWNGKRDQRNQGDQRSNGNTGAEVELCSASESSLGQSVDGLSRRLARLRREQLKALGNSIVPQCAEIIGRAIMQADQLPE